MKSNAYSNKISRPIPSPFRPIPWNFIARAARRSGHLARCDRMSALRDFGGVGVRRHILLLIASAEISPPRGNMELPPTYLREKTDV